MFTQADNEWHATNKIKIDEKKTIERVMKNENEKKAGIFFIVRFLAFAIKLKLKISSPYYTRTHI